MVARMLGGQGNFGFDAARKEYVDLVEAGIIDPAKVVRIGLENAVSVASLMLLTEATMTEIPEPARERAAEPVHAPAGPATLRFWHPRERTSGGSSRRWKIGAFRFRRRPAKVSFAARKLWTSLHSHARWPTPGIRWR